MDYLKILKTEEDICNKLWEEAHVESKDCHPLNHAHLCDFEILSFRYCKNSKALEKEVEKRCKNYLKSIGRTRDKELWCCEECIHDKHVTMDDKDDTILNVCTLDVDKRINPWNKTVQ